MKLSARLAYLAKRAKQLFKDAIPTPSLLMKALKDKKLGVTKPQADQIIDKMKIDGYDKLAKLGNQTKALGKSSSKLQPPKVEAPVQTVEAPKVNNEPMKQTRSYGPR